MPYIKVGQENSGAIDLTPSDDAPDAFLTVIMNGKVTGDGIGPHDDLLAEFPYLGPPHNSSR